MSTDRQVDANRLNAQKSTGPKTDAGKAASRWNATKHGLAGRIVEGESDLFNDRREAWVPTVNPQTDEANFALDRAVASSIRIEQCEAALDALSVSQATHARLAWDDDKKVEAATLFGRLANDPVLVAAQLASTRHGAELMIAAWHRLGEAWVARGDWSDDERIVALDLLGVPNDFRSALTPLDPPKGTEPSDWLKSVAGAEIRRLTRKKEEYLDELDALDRRQAEVAALVVLSKPAALILRYERDAWRRFRESMKEAKAPAGEDATSVTEELPARVETPAPIVRSEPRQTPAVAPTAAVVAQPLSPHVAPIMGPGLGLTGASAHLNRHDRRALAARERSA